MSETTHTPTRVQRKATGAAAIFFDGRNGKDVVEFARKFPGVEARNGGTWVSIHSNRPDGIRLRKNHWFVVDSDGALKAYTQEDFDTYFTKVRPRAVKN